jgi:hypothetical protein
VICITQFLYKHHRDRLASITGISGLTGDTNTIATPHIAMRSICLLPNGFSELYASAILSHQVTLADRYGMLAAVLDETLTDEERYGLNRLIRLVCRGQIEIVSELSVVEMA